MSGIFFDEILVSLIMKTALASGMKNSLALVMKNGLPAHDEERPSGRNAGMKKTQIPTGGGRN